MWRLGPGQLKSAREIAGLTQQRAAERLGVSQTYIALVESGHRRVTDRLASKMIKLYRLGPGSLPLEVADLNSWDAASLAKALGHLGYSGFRHLRGGRKHNPAVVLLAALTRDDLEVRVIEGLPWLAVEYYDLDWEWLTREAKLLDVQNRLGFVITLGRRVAEKQGLEAAQTTRSGRRPQSFAACA